MSALAIIGLALFVALVAYFLIAGPPDDGPGNHNVHTGADGGS